MAGAWGLYAVVFAAGMAAGLKYPRNEWLGNTTVVLLGTLLALWYHQATPDLLMGSDNPLSHPFHRLLGIPVLAGAAWCLLQQWEDLRAWARAAKTRRLAEHAAEETRLRDR